MHEKCKQQKYASEFIIATADPPPFFFNSGQKESKRVLRYIMPWVH